MLNHILNDGVAKQKEQQQQQSPILVESRIVRVTWCLKAFLLAILTENAVLSRTCALTRFAAVPLVSAWPD